MLLAADSRRRAAWRLGLLLAAGCVVVEERMEPPAPVAAAPVAIPFRSGAGSDRPYDVYYASIVDQLRQAWLDADRERLALLLDGHDRPDAPAWAQEHLAGFRRILRVMEFEAAVADRGALDLPVPLPALGEQLALTVRLGPLPSFAVRLPGGSDPARARLVLLLRMADTDGSGTQTEHATTTVVDVAATIDFAAGDAVRVPVAIEVAAGGSIVRRVAIEVFLMPGHLEVAGVKLPNRKVRLARGEVELLPRGHEQIVARPLAVLRAAVRLGDPDHFPHVYLAARELARAGTPADREAALAVLIDRTRLGRADQANNAIAALALLEPEAAVHNRERGQWLQWWARRGPQR